MSIVHREITASSLLTHWIYHILTLNHQGVNFKIGVSILSITVASSWTQWRLKSPASRLFTQPLIQVQINETIKAPLHWPL